MKVLKTNNLKNIIFGFFIIFVIGCASSLPQKTIDQISYQKIININLSKDQLYKFSLNWVKIKLTGIDRLVYKNNPEDLATGVKNSLIVNRIISNGYFEDPKLSNIKIKYKCKIDCKENQVKISFIDCIYIHENKLIENNKKIIDKNIEKKLIKNFEDLIKDFNQNVKIL